MPLSLKSICISIIKNEATLSAKNRLQELYQKQKLPLPIYDSTNLSSVPHIPSWRATVTLYDGTQYDSPICSTKTKAEIGAAECALKVAGVEHNSAKPSIVEKHFRYPVYVFIDVENQSPDAVIELCQRCRVSTNLIIYAICGFKHVSATKDYDDKRVIKALSPSSRRDGADFYIATKIGECLGEMKVSAGSVVVVTRDHFGDVMEDILRNQLGEKRTRHAVSIDEVMTYHEQCE